MKYAQNNRYTTEGLKKAIAECEWLKDHAANKTKIPVLLYALNREDPFTDAKMNYSEWKETIRALIIDFCVWVDKDGCYTDEDSTRECGSPMTLAQAVAAMILHLDDSQI